MPAPTFPCPVCDYPKLTEPARTRSGGGSYEICPSCGFQFGVTDDDEGWTFPNWRAKWEKSGRPWSSAGIPRPANWPPALPTAAAAVTEKAATSPAKSTAKHVSKPAQKPAAKPAAPAKKAAKKKK